MEEKKVDERNTKLLVKNLKKALDYNYGVSTGSDLSLPSILRTYCSIYGKPYPKSSDDCLRLALKLLRPVKVKVSAEERARDKAYAKKRKKMARYDKWVKRHPPESKKTKMSL